MKNSKNLSLILELLEVIEEINALIFSKERQMAAARLIGLEKRIITLQSVHPKTHIINKILDKVYVLHVAELYQELEADIELYEKQGFMFEVPKNETLGGAK